MRTSNLQRTALAVMLALLAGCGHKGDNTAPLAFVPADTPYVFANTESVPDAALATWRRQMQTAWPLLTETMDHALADIEAKPEAAGAAKVLRAILDEVRDRNMPELWQQAGFSQQARAAIYGIDLLPVMRLELSDPDAFRAMLARIEQKAGQSLATSRIGEQEVRTFGSDKAQGMLAIEGRHLVLAFAPGDADEVLKRRLLGLDRPAHAIDPDLLADFNKQRGYLPYGSGWVDTRRVVALLSDLQGKFANVSLESGKPAQVDTTCREEFDALAAKAPRLGFGYRKFDGDGMTMHARLDLDPATAKSLSALAPALPGAASPDALLDFAIALPVLRARDLLVAQYDAIAKAPFRCALLASANEGVAETKAKLSQTIPPPVSDFTGVRVTLGHIAWPAGDAAARPDVSGTLLIGSNNPSFMTSLAQLSVPALQGVKLAADGKPVAIPQGAVPGLPGDLDLNVALGAKVLGVALGKDQLATLSSAVTTTPVASTTLLEMNMRGEIYTTFADAIGHFSAALPEDSRKQMETQRKLYALYAQWFKHVEARIALAPEGIELIESVALRSP
jgi:predicted small lipoprotein YifL